MARKAVLEGGKRDEIIKVAMQLFFQNGYEATSIRMILDQVNGEVGMFYHYFKSKEELFNQVVAYFFKDYQKKFEGIVEQCESMEQMIGMFLKQYSVSMTQYGKLAENMHWTIQYAMSVSTIQAIKPAIEKLIGKLGYHRNLPLDIVAGQLLYSISATIHSDSFQKMSQEEQYQLLVDLFKTILAI